MQIITTDPIFSDTSLKEQNGDLVSRLTHYRDRIKTQIKNQSDQIFFLRKKLKNIISGIKEAIIVLDERGNLLFYNSQSHKLFFLEELNPPLSSSFKSADFKNTDSSESFAPQYTSLELNISEIIRSPDVLNIFKQCLKKETVIVKECAFRKKNQYLKSHFQVTALPLFYNQLKIKSVILLFFDQTDVKEFQQAHIDFVSNVSHELKTPLTSIQGYVEMLKQDLSQKKFDQFETFLQILLRNCRRMNDLMEDLLSLSNLTSQTYLEKKRLSTKEITSRVMERVKSQDHKLHYFFSAPYVMANSTWVEVVLYNLIDNACRHTPEECDVYVRWEKRRDRVLLKVIDAGEGVPEKYHQRIFERFFRVDSDRSRDRGGTGVGLALVKQSMERQGGCARAVSHKKGGMEFICEFPNS